MSKNKVIVLAALEGGKSNSAAARRYGVVRQWVHELLARYAAEGDAGLEPRSRRPRTNPLATTVAVQARFLALRAAGAVVPEPHKRPRSSLRRFTAAEPNEMWQSDFTYWALADGTGWALADGTGVEILDFIDDRSRYLLHLTAHPKVTGTVVVDAFLDTAHEHRLPASTLTNNGFVYTTRLAGGRNAFETLIASLGITQKNGSPSHPQPQGKIERFHQILKKWPKNQPGAHTIADSAELLAKFRHIYNHERPHRALKRRTPSEAYEATPKAAPSIASQGAHWRIGADRVDADGKVPLRHAGRLRHLGIGRAHKHKHKHKHKHIILLVRDADVAAVEQGTGEILAEFTIDPARGYQSKKQNTPGPKTGGVVDVSGHL